MKNLTQYINESTESIDEGLFQKIKNLFRLETTLGDLSDDKDVKIISDRIKNAGKDTKSLAKEIKNVFDEAIEKKDDKGKQKHLTDNYAYYVELLNLAGKLAKDRKIKKDNDFKKSSDDFRKLLEDVKEKADLPEAQKEIEDAKKKAGTEKPKEKTDETPVNTEVSQKTAEKVAPKIAKDEHIQAFLKTIFSPSKVKENNSLMDYIEDNMINEGSNLFAKTSDMKEMKDFWTLREKMLKSKKKDEVAGIFGNLIGNLAALESYTGLKTSEILDGIKELLTSDKSKKAQDAYNQIKSGLGN
jgi:hypothetical protein